MSAFSTWMNNRIVSRIRNRGGTFMGTRLLVLNTVGKKSGAKRANPVAWFPGDDGSWLIVASAGGAARNPAWFYNIGAHPEAVTIDVDRANVAVLSKQLDGADRVRAWKSIVEASPRFSQYESKTDRVIPVIQLTRR
jgi:deazaflavin-dependent oxidoreductase (nitroreductase family)